MTSSLVRRPGTFCWVFRGRTPRPLGLFAGHMVVWRRSGHVGFPVPAELRHLPPGLLLHGGPRPGHARHRRRAERDGAAELARLAGMSRSLAVENRWLLDLERGYDGIVVGAHARHDALRLQGQSPVQDVVEAAPSGRGWLVDGNFRETCPGEQLP